MSAGELTFPSANGGMEWARSSSAGELALVVWIRERVTKAQMQGFKLAHPKIFICELLEHVKGPVLLFQNCRISMTQSNKWEESQQGSNIDGVTEATDLEPEP